VHHDGAAEPGRRVTACLTTAPENLAISSRYNPRPARDSASPLPDFVPADDGNCRRITAILRCRLARDSATALSHEASKLPAHSAGLGAEAGA